MQPNPESGASVYEAQKQSVAAAPPCHTRRIVGLVISAIVLCLAFALPLREYAHVATTKERNSYLPLVPLIVGYLIWTKRRETRLSFTTSFTGAIFSFLIGA